MGESFRLTAVNCWIRDVLEGSFNSDDSKDAPKKMILKNGVEVGRVNILGTITALTKDAPFRFVVDDSSGQIEVIDFESERDIKVGDFVRIIALPKEYLGSKYLILEVIKKTDPLWLELKKKTIPLVSGKDDADLKERILDFIRTHDSGQGVSFEDVENELGCDVEKIVGFLLEKGFLFEIKPGFLKVLE